jgi:hypoxanthine phosphoribosyltransferase
MLLLQAQKIQQTGFQPSVVVAVARGGLVPGRVLCDLLEVPALAVTQIQFYTNINQTALQPTLKQPLTLPVKGKNVLLVDDIADTGQSLRFAQTYLKTEGAQDQKTATLYTKPQSQLTPDFYEQQTSRWVVFPWDTKETLRKISQSNPGKRAFKEELAKLVKAGLPKHLEEKLLQNIP